MPKKKVFLMPQTEKILSQMGEQIRLARLRRNIPISVIAERARVSPGTVAAVERGSSSVSMGSYAAILHAIGGMEQDLLLIGRDDVLGRTFQDLNLPVHIRASKHQSPNQPGKKRNPL